jgi:hypothetical protein
MDMPAGGKVPDGARQAKIRAELYRDVALRERSYRVQALKILPHVCARCARELSGARLRELTVHHRDHDHRNNPADGSNWELLCLYCHDNEHEKDLLQGTHGGEALEASRPTTLFNAFGGLDAVLPARASGAGAEDKPPK